MTDYRVAFPELAPYGEREHPLAGRYLIERQIGVGGMAFVFAARDLKHDRLVAVKVLKSEYGSSISADRFTREIQIAAGLTHPNILPVHDSGSADGLLYYVMPFIEGGTLIDRMKSQNPLPLGEIRRITREIGAALQFAHSRGIIHRDIKPANVLLPAGVAVVADFGLARAIENDSLDTRLTQIGVGVGTPTYMSPEQGAGDGDVDERTDQYSLACVVYEMLSGRPPFTGPSYQRLLAQHLSDSATALRSLRPEIPESVESAVSRALSKKKEDRFASIDEFLRALDGDPKGQTASWGVQPRRSLSTVALVGTGIAAVAVAAFVANSRLARLPGVSHPLDSNLVAVAPFTVFGSTNREWKEGLVDVLARDFDGAGPLRTVSPSLVLRRVQGTMDRAAAMSLAKSTGAGIVIFGQLLEAGSGGDSVRARVTVANAVRDSVIGELEVVNASTRMDLVADSIALRTLRQLGSGRSIAAVPRAYFGSRSLPALKLFLQGEQHYRQNDFRAAQSEYERAIELDSGFALAYRRMRGVLRGTNGEFDSLSLWYAARAGAENRRSSPRDSLLILADSLAAVHRSFPLFADGKWLASIRRRLATLEEASRRYPEDPEVWSELGEARVHYGDRVGVESRLALAAFEHALQKDSTYGPAFYHAIDLTMQLRGGGPARPLVDRYIQLNPTDTTFRIVQGVLRGELPRRLFAELDSARRDVSSTLALLMRFPDLNDLGSALYVRTIDRNPSIAAARRIILARRYAFRGRLKDAAGILEDSSARSNADGQGLLLFLAQKGIIPTRRADSLFAQIAQSRDPTGLPIAALWWASRGDTAALATTGRAAQRGLGNPSAALHGVAQYSESTVRALASLTHGDTAGAVAEFLRLPDSAMTRFVMPVRIEVARLLIAGGRAKQAAAYLDVRPPSASAATAWDVLWYAERGRAARLNGDNARARECYQSVITAWNAADAQLESIVAEAKSAFPGLKPRS